MDEVAPSPAWYWYYTCALGMSRAEARGVLFGHLLDLIACYQVKHEGARVKHQTDDAEDFLALLSRR